MAATIITAGPAPAAGALVREQSSPSKIPWYLWCGALAITSSTVGLWWDISWHQSIGRDTFWTPAHMAIYGCGVLVGIICGYLVLATTFGHRADLRATSVQVLGFRAPLGVFLAVWGGTAMLTAAPFDNWWHAAYGLDASIVTPPHTFLFLGMRFVTFGIITLILAALNRAAASGAGSTAGLRTLLLYAGGLLVMDQMLLLIPFLSRNQMHSAHGYVLCCVLVLPVLVLLRVISGYRWAATATTGVYTTIVLLLVWILPLFPAVPRLGPVYTNVTHMVPPAFPTLLLPAAFALDLLLTRAAKLPKALLALASGLLFTTVLVACQWPFANFLMSPRSNNWIFATDAAPFAARPRDHLPIFSNPQHGFALLHGLGEAALLSAVGAWIAFQLGQWLRGVQR